jgi:hypothetical protein
MTITNSFGYTDTTVSGAATPTLAPIPVINWNADFSVKTESAGEIVLVNTTTPYDQNEKVRFGFSEISDVYKNSDLGLDQQSSSKAGVNILVQITENVKVVDSTISGAVAYLPLSAHLVLKVPKSAYIDDATISTLLKRLIGTLYKNGTMDIKPLLKGSLGHR